MATRKRKSFGGKNGVWFLNQPSNEVDANADDTAELDIDSSSSALADTEASQKHPLAAQDLNVDAPLDHQYPNARRNPRHPLLAVTSDSDDDVDNDDAIAFPSFHPNDDHHTADGDGDGSDDDIEDGSQILSNFPDITQRSKKRQRTFGGQTRRTIFIDTNVESPLAYAKKPSTQKDTADDHDTYEVTDQSQDETHTSASTTSLLFSQASTIASPKNLAAPCRDRKVSKVAPNEKTVQPAILRPPSSKTSPKSARAYYDHLFATQKLQVEPQSPAQNSALSRSTIFGTPPERSISSTTYRTTRRLQLDSPGLTKDYEEYVAAVSKNAEERKDGDVVPWSKREFAQNRGLFFHKGKLAKGFLDE